LDLRNLGTTTGFITLVHWAVSHASLSWTHSSAKTKYDLFLNEITLSGWADVACRNTVHELPVGLTSLYIRIPKTPRTEPGKNDLHYCQRTTASGDCRLRPAGAERSRFGNGTSGWTVRLYVSKGARPIAFTTSSLGSWAFSFRASSRPQFNVFETV